MVERKHSESDELTSDAKLDEIRDQIRQAYSNSEVIRLVKSVFLTFFMFHFPFLPQNLISINGLS